MPKFEQIETDISDNILTITMKRPDRLNAFTPQMQGELIDAFDHADANDDIGAIIVTGAGRAFCAGADLSDGGSTWEKPELARDGGGRLTLRIFESLKPVIAACNGPSVGVGTTMQCAMDIRLAAAIGTLRFRVFSARRGTGSLLKLVPSSHRWHQSGTRMDLLRENLRSRRSAECRICSSDLFRA